MPMKRRTFLSSLGLGAAAFTLKSTAWPTKAFAETAVPTRKLITCYFNGGWDCLLGLDPRSPQDFNESNMATTKILPAYDQIGAGYSQDVIVPDPTNYPHMTFGPAMSTFAQAHYDKACIIRGISMDTLTHEVGRRYFITGKTPRGLSANGSSLGTLVVGQQGDKSAIPYLVSRVESYNENQPTYATGLSVNGVSDLVTVLQDGNRAPPAAIRTYLDAYRANNSYCDPAFYNRRGFLGLISESQLKARELVEAGLGDRFQFTNRNDPEMLEIAQRYGINNILSPGAQAALAYQAIKYDIAQSISIEVGNGLDTHDNNWATDHADNLQGGFNALAQLVTDLATTDDGKGGVLLDNTTLLCFSEFGRTALLNARGGRDHSIRNSALLLGAGVPKGVVVGGTSNTGMNPLTINPETGEILEGGTILTPSLIHASILESAGLSPHELRVNGINCLKG